LIPKAKRIVELKRLLNGRQPLNLSHEDVYIDLASSQRALHQKEWSLIMKESVFGNKPVFTPTTEKLANYRRSQLNYLASCLVSLGINAMIGDDYTSIVVDASEFMPKLKNKRRFTKRIALALALYIEGGIYVNPNTTKDNLLRLDFAEGAYTKDHLDYVVSILAKIYGKRQSIIGIDYILEGKIDEDAFRKEEIPIPFKVAVYEPIALIDYPEREERLKQAGLNPFLLTSDDIVIDILTDSGTGAMSLNQWLRMCVGDEAYAGSRSFENLKTAVQDITGFKFVLPTHQGRGAENVFDKVTIKEGQYVIANLFFDTTAAQIDDKKGKRCEVPVEEVYDPSILVNFKGNIDLRKLEYALKEYEGNIAYVIITITNNTAGGLPVAMANMRGASKICRKYGVMLVMDGARFAENAEFIREFEEGYKNVPIREIVREMCSYFDVMLMSSKKDAIVNIGGFIALNDEELYRKLAPVNVLFEGFPTYGGQAGYTMESLAEGIYEGTNEDYLRYRLGELRYLADKLSSLGIPIVMPVGGHAAFVDAGAFLPHIPKEQFPAQALANELYIESGIRGVEIGTLLAGRDPETGENSLAANEYLRLTIPRRVYTKEHLDYIAYMLWKVYQRRENIKGLKFVYEPPVLRHFQARFAWIDSDSLLEALGVSSLQISPFVVLTALGLLGVIFNTSWLSLIGLLGVFLGLLVLTALRIIHMKRQNLPEKQTIRYISGELMIPLTHRVFKLLKDDEISNIRRIIEKIYLKPEKIVPESLQALKEFLRADDFLKEIAEDGRLYTFRPQIFATLEHLTSDSGGYTSEAFSVFKQLLTRQKILELIEKGIFDKPIIISLFTFLEDTYRNAKGMVPEVFKYFLKLLDSILLPEMDESGRLYEFRHTLFTTIARLPQKAGIDSAKILMVMQETMAQQDFLNHISDNEWLKAKIKSILTEECLNSELQKDYETNLKRKELYTGWDIFMEPYIKLGVFIMFCPEALAVVLEQARNPDNKILNPLIHPIRVGIMYMSTIDPYLLKPEHYLRVNPVLTQKDIGKLPKVTSMQLIPTGESFNKPIPLTEHRAVIVNRREEIRAVYLKVLQKGEDITHFNSEPCEYNELTYNLPDDYPLNVPSALNFDSRLVQKAGIYLFKMLTSNFIINEEIYKDLFITNDNYLVCLAYSIDRDTLGYGKSLTVNKLDCLLEALALLINSCGLVHRELIALYHVRNSGRRYNQFAVPCGRISNIVRDTRFPNCRYGEKSGAIVDMAGDHIERISKGGVDSYTLAGYAWEIMFQLMLLFAERLQESSKKEEDFSQELEIALSRSLPRFMRILTKNEALNTENLKLNYSYYATHIQDAFRNKQYGGISLGYENSALTCHGLVDLLDYFTLWMVHALINQPIDLSRRVLFEHEMYKLGGDALTSPRGSLRFNWRMVVGPLAFFALVPVVVPFWLLLIGFGISLIWFPSVMDSVIKRLKPISTPTLFSPEENRSLLRKFSINTVIKYLRNKPALNIYPEEDYYILIKKFSDLIGIDENNCVLGNQFSEVYEWLVDLVINEGDVVTLIASSEAKSKQEEERLQESATRRFVVQWLKGLDIAAYQSKMVVISNDDSGYSREEISRFINQAPEELLIVINEGQNVFGEATVNNMAYIESGKNVILVRTLPEGLKLAGEPLTFIVARSEIIKDFHKIRQPFTVNILDIVVGQEHLKQFGPEAQVKPGQIMATTNQISLDAIKREAIKNPKLTPYQPGKGMKQTLSDLIKRNPGFNLPLVKLSSNENTQILPHKLIKVLIRKLKRIRDGKEVFNYENEFALTKQAVADYAGVKPEQVFLGHAGSEALLRAVAAFAKEGDTVVMPQFCFPTYKLACMIKGVHMIEVENNPDFSTDFAGLLNKVEEYQPQMLIFVNPANPLGTVTDKESLYNFIQDVRRVSPETIILVDEAYYEYAKYQAERDGWEYPDLVNDFIKKGDKHIIVLRSFSKILGFAGMRAGYLIANVDIINEIEKLQRSKSLIAWTISLIRDGLKQKEWIEERCRENYENSSYLLKEFKLLKAKSPQFFFINEAIRTAGNFLFFGIEGKDRLETFEQLENRGLIVRPIIKHFLRVTIGTRGDCELFIRALREILGATTITKDPAREKPTSTLPNDPLMKEAAVEEEIRVAKAVSTQDKEYVQRTIVAALALVLIDQDIHRELRKMLAYEIRAGPLPNLWGVLRNNILYLDLPLLTNSLPHELIITLIHEAGVSLGRSDIRNEKFAQDCVRVPQMSPIRLQEPVLFPTKTDTVLKSLGFPPFYTPSIERVNSGNSTPQAILEIIEIIAQIKEVFQLKPQAEKAKTPDLLEDLAMSEKALHERGSVLVEDPQALEGVRLLMLGQLYSQKNEFDKFFETILAEAELVIMRNKDDKDEEMAHIIPRMISAILREAAIKDDAQEREYSDAVKDRLEGLCAEFQKEKSLEYKRKVILALLRKMRQEIYDAISTDKKENGTEEEPSELELEAVNMEKLGFVRFVAEQEINLIGTEVIDLSNDEERKIVAYTYQQAARSYFTTFVPTLKELNKAEDYLVEAINLLPSEPIFKFYLANVYILKTIFYINAGLLELAEDMYIQANAKELTQDMAKHRISMGGISFYLGVIRFLQEKADEAKDIFLGTFKNVNSQRGIKDIYRYYRSVFNHCEKITEFFLKMIKITSLPGDFRFKLVDFLIFSGHEEELRKVKKEIVTNIRGVLIGLSYEQAKTELELFFKISPNNTSLMPLKEKVVTIISLYAKLTKALANGKTKEVSQSLKEIKALNPNDAKAAAFVEEYNVEKEKERKLGEVVREVGSRLTNAGNQVASSIELRSRGNPDKAQEKIEQVKKNLQEAQRLLSGLADTCPEKEKLQNMLTEKRSLLQEALSKTEIVEGTPAKVKKKRHTITSSDVLTMNSKEEKAEVNQQKTIEIYFTHNTQKLFEGIGKGNQQAIVNAIKRLSAQYPVIPHIKFERDLKNFNKLTLKGKKGLRLIYRVFSLPEKNKEAWIFFALEKRQDDYENVLEKLKPYNQRTELLDIKEILKECVLVDLNEDVSLWSWLRRNTLSIAPFLLMISFFPSLPFLLAIAIILTTALVGYLSFSLILLPLRWKVMISQIQIYLKGNETQQAIKLIEKLREEVNYCSPIGLVNKLNDLSQSLLRPAVLFITRRVILQPLAALCLDEDINSLTNKVAIQKIFDLIQELRTASMRVRGKALLAAVAFEETLPFQQKYPFFFEEEGVYWLLKNCIIPYIGKKARKRPHQPIRWLSVGGVNFYPEGARCLDAVQTIILALEAGLFLDDLEIVVTDSNDIALMQAKRGYYDLSWFIHTDHPLENKQKRVINRYFYIKRAGILRLKKPIRNHIKVQCCKAQDFNLEIFKGKPFDIVSYIMVEYKIEFREQERGPLLTNIIVYTLSQVLKEGGILFTTAEKWLRELGLFEDVTEKFCAQYRNNFLQSERAVTYTILQGEPLTADVIIYKKLYEHVNLSNLNVAFSRLLNGLNLRFKQESPDARSLAALERSEKLLEKAWELAKKIHRYKGKVQKRDNGQPYPFHLLTTDETVVKVFHAFKQFKIDTVEQLGFISLYIILVIGLLHDSREEYKGKKDIQKIIRDGFREIQAPEELITIILSGITMLTKEPGIPEEKYEARLVAKAKNHEKLLKMADKLVNLSTPRYKKTIEEIYNYKEQALKLIERFRSSTLEDICRISKIRVHYFYTTEIEKKGFKLSEVQAALLRERKGYRLIYSILKIIASFKVSYPCGGHPLIKFLKQRLGIKSPTPSNLLFILLGLIWLGAAVYSWHGDLANLFFYHSYLLSLAGVIPPPVPSSLRSEVLKHLTDKTGPKRKVVTPIGLCDSKEMEANYLVFPEEKAPPQNYPLVAAQEAHQKAMEDFGPWRLVIYRNLKTEYILTKNKALPRTRLRDKNLNRFWKKNKLVLKSLLKELEINLVRDLTSCVPFQNIENIIRNTSFIITTDHHDLGIDFESDLPYIAGCKILALNEVFLHPDFFNRPREKQLEIIRHEVREHIILGLEDKERQISILELPDDYRKSDLLFKFIRRGMQKGFSLGGIREVAEALRSLIKQGINPRYVNYKDLEEAQYRINSANKFERMIVALALSCILIPVSAEILYRAILVENDPEVAEEMSNALEFLISQGIRPHNIKVSGLDKLEARLNSVEKKERLIAIRGLNCTLLQGAAEMLYERSFIEDDPEVKESIEKAFIFLENFDIRPRVKEIPKPNLTYKPTQKTGSKNHNPPRSFGSLLQTHWLAGIIAVLATAKFFGIDLTEILSVFLSNALHLWGLIGVIAINLAVIKFNKLWPLSAIPLSGRDSRPLNYNSLTPNSNTEDINIKWMVNPQVQPDGVSECFKVLTEASKTEDEKIKDLEHIIKTREIKLILPLKKALKLTSGEQLRLRNAIKTAIDSLKELVKVETCQELIARMGKDKVLRGIMELRRQAEMRGYEGETYFIKAMESKVLKMLVAVGPNDISLGCLIADKNGHIFRLGVEKKHHQLGIGTLLFNHFKDIFEGQEILVNFYATGEEGEIPIKFFKSVGMVISAIHRKGNYFQGVLNMRDDSYLSTADKQPEETVTVISYQELLAQVGEGRFFQAIEELGDNAGWPLRNDEIIREIKDNRLITLIAVDSDYIALGYLIANNKGYILWLAVKEKYRLRGIGKKLFDRYKAIAILSGLDKIWSTFIITKESDEGWKKFCEAIGMDVSLVDRLSGEYHAEMWLKGNYTYPGEPGEGGRKATREDIANCLRHVENYLKNNSLVITRNDFIFVDKTKSGKVADLETIKGKVAILKWLAARAPPFGKSEESRLFQILINDLLRHELSEFAGGSHQKAIEISITHFKNHPLELTKFIKALEYFGIRLDKEYLNRLLTSIQIKVSRSNSLKIPPVILEILDMLGIDNNDFSAAFFREERTILLLTKIELDRLFGFYVDANLYKAKKGFPGGHKELSNLVYYRWTSQGTAEARKIWSKIKLIENYTISLPLYLKGLEVDIKDTIFSFNTLTNYLRSLLINLNVEKLREVFRSGLLCAIIPATTNLVNEKSKYQYYFHEYPLDEHSIRCIEYLKEAPEYYGLSGKDKEIVTWALLLHDIAKKGGSLEEREQGLTRLTPEHPYLSAVMAARILVKDLGYKPVVPEDEFNLTYSNFEQKIKEAIIGGCVKVKSAHIAFDTFISKIGRNSYIARIIKLIFFHDVLGNLAFFKDGDFRRKIEYEDFIPYLTSEKELLLFKIISEADIKAIRQGLYTEEKKEEINFVYNRLLSTIQKKSGSFDKLQFLPIALLAGIGLLGGLTGNTVFALLGIIGGLGIIFFFGIRYLLRRKGRFLRSPGYDNFIKHYTKKEVVTKSICEVSGIIFELGKNKAVKLELDRLNTDEQSYGLKLRVYCETLEIFAAITDRIQEEYFKNEYIDKSDICFFIFEQLANAFVHGNKADLKFPLFLNIRKSEDSVILEIYDMKLPSIFHNKERISLAYAARLHGRKKGLKCLDELRDDYNNAISFDRLNIQDGNIKMTLSTITVSGVLKSKRNCPAGGGTFRTSSEPSPTLPGAVLGCISTVVAIGLGWLLGTLSKQDFWAVNLLATDTVITDLTGVLTNLFSGGEFLSQISGWLGTIFHAPPEEIKGIVLSILSPRQHIFEYAQLLPLIVVSRTVRKNNAKIVLNTLHSKVIEIGFPNSEYFYNREGFKKMTRKAWCGLGVEYDGNFDDIFELFVGWVNRHKLLDSEDSWIPEPKNGSCQEIEFSILSAAQWQSTRCVDEFYLNVEEIEVTGKPKSDKIIIFWDQEKDFCIILDDAFCQIEGRIYNLKGMTFHVRRGIFSEANVFEMLRYSDFIDVLDREYAKEFHRRLSISKLILILGLEKGKVDHRHHVVFARVSRFYKNTQVRQLEWFGFTHWNEYYQAVQLLVKHRDIFDFGDDPFILIRALHRSLSAIERAFTGDRKCCTDLVIQRISLLLSQTKVKTLKDALVLLKRIERNADKDLSKILEEASSSRRASDFGWIRLLASKGGSGAKNMNNFFPHAITVQAMLKAADDYKAQPYISAAFKRLGRILFRIALLESWTVVACLLQSGQLTGQQMRKEIEEAITKLAPDEREIINRRIIATSRNWDRRLKEKFTVYLKGINYNLSDIDWVIGCINMHEKKSDEKLAIAAQAKEFLLEYTAELRYWQEWLMSRNLNIYTLGFKLIELSRQGKPTRELARKLGFILKTVKNNLGALYQAGLPPKVAKQLKRAIPFLESTIVAYRKNEKPEFNLSLFAANSLFVSTIIAIEKEKKCLVNERIKEEIKVKRVVVSKGSIWVRRQLYESVRSGRPAVLRYRLIKHSSSYEALRALDHQVDSEIEERDWLLECLGVLEGLINLKEEDSALLSQEIKKILIRLNNIRIEDKRMARIILRAALELLETQRLKQIAELLDFARDFFSLRIKETERIINRLSAARNQILLPYVEKGNRYLLDKVMKILRSLGYTYVLAQKILREDFLNQEHQAYTYLREPELNMLFSVFNKINNTSEFPFLAEQVFKLMRDKVVDVALSTEFIQYHRTLYVEARMGNSLSIKSRQEAFNKAFLEFYQRSNSVRGSPQLYWSLFYQAAFVSRNLRNNPPKDNPVFSDLSNYITHRQIERGNYRVIVRLFPQEEYLFSEAEGAVFTRATQLPQEVSCRLRDTLRTSSEPSRELQFSPIALFAGIGILGGLTESIILGLLGILGLVVAIISVKSRLIRDTFQTISEPSLILRKGRKDPFSLEFIDKAINELEQFKKNKKLNQYIGRCVSVFGSARDVFEKYYYNSVSRMTYTFDCHTITGGGGGVMLAASKGAKKNSHKSIGLLIKLLKLEPPNAFLDIKLYFKYFFSRKMTFIILSKAFVVCKGGFGTLDELFEILALLDREIINKPVFILGDKFYSQLMLLINDMEKRGFTRRPPEELKRLVQLCVSIKQVIRKVNALPASEQEIRLDRETIKKGFEDTLRKLEGADAAIAIVGSGTAIENTYLGQQVIEISRHYAPKGVPFIVRSGRRFGGKVAEGISKAALEVPEGTKLSKIINLKTDTQSSRIQADIVVEYSYMFQQKVALTQYSSAYIFFPGGFNTLDLLFNILTLTQTGKIKQRPIVLIGRGFWEPWHRFFTEVLLKNRVISEKDILLYKIVDNAQEAIAVIEDFYKNAPISSFRKTQSGFRGLIKRLMGSKNREEGTVLNSKQNRLLSTPLGLSVSGGIIFAAVKKAKSFLLRILAKSLLIFTIVFSLFSLSSCKKEDIFADIPVELHNRQLIFTDGSFTNHNLYIMNADGTDKRILLSVDPKSQYIGKAVWSPDGNMVACYRNGGTVLLDTLGNIISQTGASGDFSWTPDNKSLIYSKYCNGLYEFSLKQAQTSMILKTNDNTYDCFVSFSPDRRHLAFAHYEFGTTFYVSAILDFDYGKIPYAGENRYLGVTNPEITMLFKGRSGQNDEDIYLQWSPDSKKIIFSGYDESSFGYRVYVADVETKEIIKTEATPYMRLSPNGKEIAYGELFLIDIDGSNARTIVNDGVFPFGAIEGERNISWSNDGKYIFLGLDRDIYIASRDGSTVSKLSQMVGENNYVQYIDFRPKKISYYLAGKTTFKSSFVQPRENAAVIREACLTNTQSSLGLLPSDLTTVFLALGVGAGEYWVLALGLVVMLTWLIINNDLLRKYLKPCQKYSEPKIRMLQEEGKPAIDFDDHILKIKSRMSQRQYGGNVNPPRNIGYVEDASREGDTFRTIPEPSLAVLVSEIGRYLELNQVRICRIVRRNLRGVLKRQLIREGKICQSLGYVLGKVLAMNFAQFGLSFGDSQNTGFALESGVPKINNGSSQHVWLTFYYQGRPIRLIELAYSCSGQHFRNKISFGEYDIEKYNYLNNEILLKKAIKDDEFQRIADSMNDYSDEYLWFLKVIGIGELDYIEYQQNIVTFAVTRLMNTDKIDQILPEKITLALRKAISEITERREKPVWIIRFEKAWGYFMKLIAIKQVKWYKYIIKEQKNGK